MNYCRLCLGGVTTVLSLTPTPIANNFSQTPDPYGVKLPLELAQRKGCGHVQIGYIVPGAVLFNGYSYRTPEAERPRLRQYALDLASQYPQYLGSETRSGTKSMERPRVLEIGSNNGMLITELNRAGFWAVGVDPAGPQSGMPRWFSRKSAQAIAGSLGRMGLILANNVLAHVDDLRDTLGGVAALLADEGVFIFEVQYLPDMVAGGMFDMIYHEHKDYHTLTPLPRTLKKFGLRIVKVERLPTHGGSIRVYCRRGSGGLEVFDPPIDFTHFEQRIEQERDRLTHALPPIPCRLVAFGATAKSCTLIHHFGLAGRIAYCVDETPEKQGRYIPGTAIKISALERLQREPPDAILLTAWNYAEILRPRLKEYPLIIPFEQRQAQRQAA